ncbi:hypothetical protein ACFW2I_40465, partial [Streptomyces nigra]|uniref:hypothetical protein n=1 Tax=Streptomyces nigra TaxID=1827580 RepID=UPI0036BDC88E
MVDAVMKTFSRNWDTETEPVPASGRELKDYGAGVASLPGEIRRPRMSFDDFKRGHDLPPEGVPHGSPTRENDLKLIRLLTELLERKTDAEMNARRELDVLHAQIATQKTKLEKQAAELAEVKARV